MYDRPRTITILVPAVNLAAAKTQNFRLPKGVRGRLVDVLLSVTTSVAWSTTAPILKVGVAGTLDASASINVPVTTAPAGLAGSAIVGNPGLGGSLSDAFSRVPPVLAADTDFVFTVVAGVGTPSGVADVALVFDIGV